MEAQYLATLNPFYRQTVWVDFMLVFGSMVDPGQPWCLQHMPRFWLDAAVLISTAPSRTCRNRAPWRYVSSSKSIH